MVAPPLDAKRPTRGIRARAQAASAQGRPLDAALAARTTGRCTPAALHVCHLSLCRQSSAPSRARPCRALRKCTTRALGPPPHRSPAATYAARHEAALGRTNSFPAPCSCQAYRAARRLRTPRARPAASSCRLVGGSPCRAGVLRWRTTRVAARPPRGGLLAGTSHARGNPPQAVLPQPHLPPPARPRALKV